MNQQDIIGDLKAPKNPNLTTRGTPRQRVPKGFWQGVRYSILESDPPEMNGASLNKKLRRMAPGNRHRADAKLEELSDEDRREFVLKLLAGYKVSA